LERESSEEPSSPSSSITPTPPPQQDQQDQPAERPDIPYATLIAQSLLSHPRRRRTLQEIYTWIQDHHAFFKSKNKNWQSSIRHNLLSSPAFVLYGPRPGEESSADKKNKRGKHEWGISPEYEGLIGDLSAKEGDTSKLSDKLHKKKPAPPKPKPQPPQPPPVIPPKEPTMSTSPPAPTHTEDKSKLEEIVKNLQGKGVDMGALLQEALAKMKGIPVKPPPAPPPPKRLKTFPEKTQTFPSASTTNLPLNNQLPSTMPMPLPYTATKVAPIPMVGANIVQIKKEPFVNAPVPSLSPTIPPPTSGSTTDEASPKLIESLPAVSTQPTPQSNCANVETKLETAASKRSPRGKKRPLEP
jgi:forkhead box protein K